jgi:hypothetical protein
VSLFLRYFFRLMSPWKVSGRLPMATFSIPHHERGLGETHRKELNDLLSNFANTSKEQVFKWLDKFLTLNTFEISIPGLKDKELVPPGKTGMIISFLAEYELFKKIQEAGWLEEFIAGLENRLLR